MIVSDEVIPARAGWSRVLARGDVLRLVDLVRAIIYRGETPPAAR